jgi:UDPglucose--hexose-1-phosphate uridylyltransferase
MRIDPLTGLRTILAEGEDMAPAADGSLSGPSEPPARPGANPSRDLFYSAPARGVHERLESPSGAFFELAADDLEAAAEGWRERMRAHAYAACLHLALTDAGAGAAAQADLWALPFVPAQLAREREHFTAYATRTMGGNALGDLVQEEVRRRDRVVAIDEEAVCMAPYASRVPYQLMLAPRRPRARYQDPGPSGARLLHDALGRLSRALGAPPPLALWVRTAPRGAEHYCWRIDVVPSVGAGPGALELGTGLAVNPLAPEHAAAALREA